MTGDNASATGDVSGDGTSDGSPGERDDWNGPVGDATQTRRTFVKAAGAATAGLAVGAGALGTASAEGIPTPWLERDGNLIVDPQGNMVTLRGVNIADPARLNDDDRRYHVTAPQVTRWALDETEGWYNRIIRIPCQPGDIAGAGSGRLAPGEMTQSDVESYIENHLRPVVDVCREQGAYCIVDYHRHFDSQLLYTNDTLDQEVQMFWETVAPVFAEESHVLYEVYNEPIAPYPGHNQYNGGADVTDPASEEAWLTWRDAAQPWVDTIQANAPQTPVLIGSPRWSQFTYWAPEHEFSGDNLAYTGHVYAHPNLRPLQQYFGTPAEDVPVFMTEFGFDDEGQEYIKGTQSVEGQQFANFFAENPHVHWQVWCFDPRWEPAMFSEDQGVWTLRTGEGFHGKFFKDLLAQYRNDDLPGDAGGTPTDGTATETATETATPTATDTPTPTPEGCDAPAAPAWSDGTTPYDVDDDGVYEDFNGNCEFDSDDVVTYFQQIDRAGIQENPGYYDANGNGNADFDDIVTLFQSL